MQRIIYLGPPGTGKTTTLLQNLETVLHAGTPPERIAFLTFTKRARMEALTRVEKHLGKNAKDLPYFRTIHSMAYRALKLQPGDVMGVPELGEFGSTMGLTFGKTALEEQASEGINSLNKGDYLMAVDTLSRLKGVSPKVIYDLSSAAQTPCDWPTVEHFIKSYRLYKEDRGLLDFTGVLEQFIKNGLALDVDIAFIDEAQDLSALQWFVALTACQGANAQFVAGDDDQAIFKWAGADVEFFQNLDGHREVLSQSHRLPRVVHKLANGVLTKIKHRLVKEFQPRDAMGRIYRHATLRGVAMAVEPAQKWLWLVRNRYLITGLKERLEQDGVVYTTQHGQCSIAEIDRDCVYTWERLRNGRSVAVSQARNLYSKLKTKEQIKHGFKALPQLEDEQFVDIKELTTNQGLLVNPLLPWFEVLMHISIPKRAYYRKLLREHNTLRLEPQVVVETIHGAKGAECDNVALFLDMSRRVAVEFQQTPDDEHRVWYVGATRARETLHLVFAHGQHAYSFPKPEQ